MCWGGGETPLGIFQVTVYGSPQGFGSSCVTVYTELLSKMTYSKNVKSIHSNFNDFCS